MAIVMQSIIPSHHLEDIRLVRCEDFVDAMPSDFIVKRPNSKVTDQVSTANCTKSSRF